MPRAAGRSGPGGRPVLGGGLRAGRQERARRPGDPGSGARAALAQGRAPREFAHVDEVDMMCGASARTESMRRRSPSTRTTQGRRRPGVALRGRAEHGGHRLRGGGVHRTAVSGPGAGRAAALRAARRRPLRSGRGRR
ncbi:hypothetical protein ASR50_34295 [Streptomyces sp. 4F]|uniref:hypothetical protein n=1 Tax=Actinospica acidiphila TaxID=304899 RepID=UPI00073ADC67|nr:hypothetical protein [Actinospica acidiphila]ALV48162.1 hypothetical protein ASR50_01145 [Streptomyces sp. 4F]ALV53984.1 hypothetical protein ASR50_34295 [Streptomyces sp. 4F]MBM4826647.1 hypothetical protein [Actinospica acidiphila]